MVKYPRTRVHDEPLLALGLKKKSVFITFEKSSCGQDISDLCPLGFSQPKGKCKPGDKNLIILSSCFIIPLRWFNQTRSQRSREPVNSIQIPFRVESTSDGGMENILHRCQEIKSHSLITFTRKERS